MLAGNTEDVAPGSSKCSAALYRERGCDSTLQVEEDRDASQDTLTSLHFNIYNANRETHHHPCFVKILLSVSGGFVCCFFFFVFCRHLK